jgi:diguanylate cyclase (GGDEF)-like protein/PAS domain S-box-containing protein
LRRSVDATTTGFQGHLDSKGGQMKSFFNTFTTRMVMAELVVHALLAASLFFLLLPLLEQDYQSRFMQQAQQGASRIAALLRNTPQPYNLDAIATHGDFLHARLAAAADATPGFEQDFGNGNNHLYQISMPLLLAGEPYVLELGYDETSTAQQIANAYQFGLYLVAGYLLLAALSAALLGPQLTRPLQRLRHSALNIAAGQIEERLTTGSGITEIKALATDLEQMRGKLVAQREALAIREARISAIMDNVADALVTIDELGQIDSFNMAAERIFGYSAAEVIGQSVNTLFAAPLLSRTGDNSEQPVAIEQHAPYETLGRRKNGSTFHMEATISEICELAGCISIVICRDISAQRAAEVEINSLKEDLEQRVVKRTRELASVNKELQHQALHDALTSLPNRVLLQDRLQQATRAAKRDNHALALMITDLDRFKEINDTLGHHYGDLLLQQVAVRMRSALRDSDTVARLGGDEFAVLLPTISSEEQAIQAAVKIAKAMEAPFILENQHFHVGISIGIALYPKDGDNPTHLMRRADVAMYVAKRAQSSYAFYNPDQDQHSASRLTLVGELRRALEQKQLIVHYQPTVDLKQREVTGVEALLRWDHPTRGMVLPDEFIPLAEQTGLIKGLTIFVLNEALQQLHMWQKAGLHLRMAVNLSARNLNDPDLVRQLDELLNRWQVLPQQLQLEITESAIMEDPPRAMSTLSRLYAMGIKLSIDDFGTGYSSLAYLKQLPVHEIKIDRSFVKDMAINNEDRVIVRSTIDLAFNMGHRVIAEGVDSQETLNLLTGMGCDLAQGFFISSPLGSNELYQWLRDNPDWHTNLKPQTARVELETA